MKRIITLSVLIIFGCLISNGQEILEKKYFKKINSTQVTNEKQGKFVQLKIQENDSTVYFEKREIKSNKLLELKRYCNYIPYGKWLLYSKSPKDNYEVTYNNTAKDGIISYNLKYKKLINEGIQNFEDPIFPNNENKFIFFVFRNLRYPDLACKKGISGRVMSQFIINEEGKITDLSIVGRAQPMLDKEATRIILSSPIWTPAKINGRPIKVYVQYPINFIL